LRNLFLRETGFRFQQAQVGGKACGELAKTSRARRRINRVEAGAVGWQKARRRRGGRDGFANAGDFIGAGIVPHDDVARRQGRNANLRDTGEELRAVDRAIEDTRARPDQIESFDR